MAKSSEAAAAAVERIQREAFAQGLKQGRTEGYRAGWEACAEKIAKALEVPASVPRTFVSSRQTSEDVYGRFIKSSWPSYVSEEARAVKIDHLGLPPRVYNVLIRVFIDRFGYSPQTVGDIVDKLTPREIVDLAPDHNSLGEKSVERLVEKFTSIGIVLQSSD